MTSTSSTNYDLAHTLRIGLSCRVHRCKPFVIVFMTIEHQFCACLIENSPQCLKKRTAAGPGTTARTHPQNPRRAFWRTPPARHHENRHAANASPDDERR